MDSLPFKSTTSAFEYAKKFIRTSKLSVGHSFIGIVRKVDASDIPASYLVEIICKTGTFFRRQQTKIVCGLQHPDLKFVIQENDLVIFGAENISMKIPAGYLLYKLNPVLDLNTMQFEICRNIKKFKVFVDNHFHYQNEDERYLHGEFESLEEAISACKNIVDISLEGLLENCSPGELKEKYYMFGDDPFIVGGDFSASKYVDEKIQFLLNASNATAIGVGNWQHDIDYKYGLLLPESEIMEGDENIYFCQTNRKKLCVAWSLKDQTWQVNIQRSLLEGLSFSTPKRFEQIVFGGNNNNVGYYRKQCLVEYLLLGLDADEIKTLTIELDSGANIEFAIEGRIWNEILIGKSVGIEGGACTYSKKNSKEKRVLPFAIACKDQEAIIEVILDDYENYEQHIINIKNFGGYYGNV